MASGLLLAIERIADQVLRRPELHIVETTVLKYGLPVTLINWDINKFSNTTDFNGHVFFEVFKVNYQYIVQVPDFPPRAYIFPKRPYRKAVFI